MADPITFHGDPGNTPSVYRGEPGTSLGYGATGTPMSPGLAFMGQDSSVPGGALEALLAGLLQPVAVPAAPSVGKRALAGVADALMNVANIKSRGATGTGHAVEAQQARFERQKAEADQANRQIGQLKFAAVREDLAFKQQAAMEAQRSADIMNREKVEAENKAALAQKQDHYKRFYAMASTGLVDPNLDPDSVSEGTLSKIEATHHAKLLAETPAMPGVPAGKEAKTTLTQEPGQPTKRDTTIEPVGGMGAKAKAAEDKALTAAQKLEYANKGVPIYDKKTGAALSDEQIIKAAKEGADIKAAKVPAAVTKDLNGLLLAKRRLDDLWALLHDEGGNLRSNLTGPQAFRPAFMGGAGLSPDQQRFQSISTRLRAEMERAAIGGRLSTQLFTLLKPAHPDITNVATQNEKNILSAIEAVNASIGLLQTENSGLTDEYMDNLRKAMSASEHIPTPTTADDVPVGGK